MSNKQKNELETKKLESDKENLIDKNKKEQDPQTTKGDGYVPPAPEVPSAQNARQHDGPLTSKTPRGGH